MAGSRLYLHGISSAGVREVRIWSGDSTGWGWGVRTREERWQDYGNGDNLPAAGFDVATPMTYLFEILHDIPSLSILDSTDSSLEVMNLLVPHNRGFPDDEKPEVIRLLLPYRLAAVGNPKLSRI